MSGPGFGLGSEDRTGPARVRSGQGFRPKTGQVKKGVMVSARLSPLDFIPSPDPTLALKGEGRRVGRRARAGRGGLQPGATNL